MSLVSSCKSNLLHDSIELGLGDSCFDTSECLLATENTHCRESRKTDRLRISWASSGASLRKCYCAQGFTESQNRLKCLPASDAANEGDANSTQTTKASTIFALSASSAMDSKHHYELVIATNQTDQQRVLPPSEPAAKSQAPAQVEAGAVTTTAPTPTSTTLPRAAGKGKPPNPSTLGKPKVSSLGKPCSSSAECRARDPHSDCVGGLCECTRPTIKCSSNSTGCHGDTFQCRNGQCVSWYFVCDQIRNCEDGSDEDECQPFNCPPEAFQCDNGACLARGKLCNGKRDCADGSDERLCSPPAAGQHQREGPSLAAPTRDGGSHSPGACHPKAFTCDDGHCLPAYVFCNAVEDCADGSDENEALCERVWSRRKWQPAPPGQRGASNMTALDSSGASPNSANPQTTVATTTALPPPPPPVTLSAPTSGPVQAAAAAAANSPLVKADRLAINKMLAALNLAARTPENRGRQEARKQHSAQGEGRSARLLRPNELEPAECPKSAFTCRNGKCRSSAILCSGVDGCGDNSDEDRCEVCMCEPA